MGISKAITNFFNLVFLLLTISILLTWIPNIKWNNEPFKTLRSFSEIFLAPFRRIIPPIGMIDISPIIAFFCLGLLKEMTLSLLSMLGL